MESRRVVLQVVLGLVLVSGLVEAQTTKRILAWGSNQNGLLLQNDTALEQIPVVAWPEWFDEREVVSISAGADYGAAVDDLGHVFTWGSNSVGQLGNSSVGTGVSLEVVRVSQLAEHTVVQVATARQTSIVLTSTGSVWSWGSNTRGLLGNGTGTGASVVEPVEVNYHGENGEAKWIGCGATFCGLLTDANAAYMWGNNENGELGFYSDTFVFVTIPAAVNVTSLEGRHFVQLSLGSKHVLALTDDSRVMAWGANEDGQLGYIGVDDAFWPLFSNFAAAVGDRVIQVSAGNAHSLILTEAGLIYGWGLSQMLQLANAPAPTNQLTPYAIPLTVFWGKVISIHGYGDSSFATSERGRFYGWGQAANYILGANTTSNTPGPTRVVFDNLPSSLYIVSHFANSPFATTAYAIMDEIPLGPFPDEPSPSGPSEEPPPFNGFPTSTPPSPSPFSAGFPIPTSSSSILLPSTFLLSCCLFGFLSSLL